MSTFNKYNVRKKYLSTLLLLAYLFIITSTSFHYHTINYVLKLPDKSIIENRAQDNEYCNFNYCPIVHFTISSFNSDFIEYSGQSHIPSGIIGYDNRSITLRFISLHEIQLRAPPVLV